jgi:hypothetical protein
MTLAPGLLDRRVVFYAPQDGGADGFVRTVYVRTGEWWGRIDQTADAEQVPLSPQGHIEGRVAAAATVADYVPVPRGGVMREAGGETLYHVRGIVALRALRSQRVTLEAVEPTAYGEYDVYDDVEVLDGVHLLSSNGQEPAPPVPPITLPRAFNAAYSAAFGPFS